MDLVGQFTLHCQSTEPIITLLAPNVNSWYTVGRDAQKECGSKFPESERDQEEERFVCSSGGSHRNRQQIEKGFCLGSKVYQKRVPLY